MDQKTEAENMQACIWRTLVEMRKSLIKMTELLGVITQEQNKLLEAERKTRKKELEKELEERSEEQVEEEKEAPYHT